MPKSKETCCNYIAIPLVMLIMPALIGWLITALDSKSCNYGEDKLDNKDCTHARLISVLIGLLCGAILAGTYLTCTIVKGISCYSFLSENAKKARSKMRNANEQGEHAASNEHQILL